MAHDDHAMYADDCDLDRTRRKLLIDFESVRNPGCSKWAAKRKFDAEKHLTYLDERVLKHDHGEFTFYSAAITACGICGTERQQYCEPDDIWFWAERRQWHDISGRLCPLHVFLPGDLAIESATRWVGGQPITVYLGNKAAQKKAARWIVKKMESVDNTCHLAFDPPYYIDTTFCAQSHFRGFRLVISDQCSAAS